LSRELKTDGRILVQYVPHAFGARAMNLAFPGWLFLHRNRMPIDVMFHEVAVPLERGQPWRHNLLGVITRVMALLVARAATRSFIAIQAWEGTLRPLVRRNARFTWLPVPSNIPVAQHDAIVEELKRLYRPSANGFVVGHFATYNKWTAEALEAGVLPILAARPEAALLLIGGESEEFRGRLLRNYPELAARVHATGKLDPIEVSRHIGASDLMVQPYPDGVSGRRGSAMAVLAHGHPMVTTAGHLTESLWRHSGAVELIEAGNGAALGVAIARLMNDSQGRMRLGTAAAALYADLFDLPHTIAALRRGTHRPECERRVETKALPAQQTYKCESPR
jgi:hypothetical protein